MALTPVNHYLDRQTGLGRLDSNYRLCPPSREATHLAEFSLATRVRKVEEIVRWFAGDSPVNEDDEYVVKLP